MNKCFTNKNDTTNNLSPKKPSLESHEDKLDNENESHINDDRDHTKEIFNNLLSVMTSIAVIKS